MVVEFVFNFALIFAMLFAPSFLFIALQYRKKLGVPVFVWHKSEMVIVTIVFFILTLIFFILGVALLFSFWDNLRFEAASANLMENAQLIYGFSCMLILSGLAMTYFALRRLLVQMVMDEGIMFNEKYIPFPSKNHLLRWEAVVDYYIQPDYPNAVFTFIVNSEDLKFSRMSVKVPIFLKDEFQAFIEKKIYSVSTIRTSSKISSHNFSEN